MYNVYTLFMEKINKMHWLAYKRSARVIANRKPKSTKIDWILKGKSVGALLELANRPRCIHNTFND